MSLADAIRGNAPSSTMGLVRINSSRPNPEISRPTIPLLTRNDYEPPPTIDIPTPIRSLTPTSDIEQSSPTSTTKPANFAPVSPTIQGIARPDSPRDMAKVPGFIASPRGDTVPLSPRSIAATMYTPMVGLSSMTINPSNVSHNNNQTVAVPTPIPTNITPSTAVDGPLSPRVPIEITEIITNMVDVDPNSIEYILTNNNLTVIGRIVVKRSSGQEEVHYIKVSDQNDNVYYVEIDTDGVIDIKNGDLRTKYVSDTIVPYRIRRGDYQSSLAKGAAGVVVECKNQLSITRRSSRQTEPMELTLQVVTGQDYADDCVQYPLIRMSQIISSIDSVNTIVSQLNIELRQLRIDECLHSDQTIQDLISRIANNSNELFAKRQQLFQTASSSDIDTQLRLCKINEQISVKLNEVLSMINDLNATYS